MAKIQVKRGLKSQLQTLSVGEFGFCTDTDELFIGTLSGNVMVYPINNSGSNVVDSTINGNIIVDGVEIQVYDGSGKSDVGHKHTLADVEDVDVTVKNNGDALVYDSTSGKFKPQPVTTGTSSNLNEKLVVKYMHVGNTELIISAVDWATGTVTFNSPHGLSTVTSTPIIMCPVSWDISNPTIDLKAMPIEWMKPQGITSNSMNVGLALLGIDSVTAKVVKASDGTTILTVNTGLIENGTIDHTKFRFEVPNANFSISNLPLLRKFKIRVTGFIRAVATTSSIYRYTRLFYTAEDNSSNEAPYIQIMGITQSSNPYNAAGLFYDSEWILDYTSQQASTTVNTRIFGRRNGYANQIDSLTAENNVKSYSSVAKPIKGITRFENSLPAQSYMYFANGTIIEVRDLGGSN